MKWFLLLVVAYFLFAGDPPLIDDLHDYITQYTKQKEKSCT